MYLVKRRRLWYAMHDIPADVHDILGSKRFVKSLRTGDKDKARQRAALLEAHWRTEIAKARKASGDDVEADALFWRGIMEKVQGHEKEMIRDRILDEARNIAGIMDGEVAENQNTEPHQQASRFIGIATGKLVRLDEHLDEYIATLKNEAKTVDMKRSTIKRFCEEFPFISDVHRKSVQRWVNKRGQDGKAVATIRRSLSELRGYWTYLTSIEVVPDDSLPFDKRVIPKASKRGAGDDDRQPFEPGDVVRLLKAAEEKGDSALADLIRLGMWTGARIEALCSLRIEHVTADAFEVIADKNEAGRRIVPIHSKLKPTIARLVSNSKDGYVLSNLTMNKYGDRSNAIGKRFGRLKSDLGFGEVHVFHSIRKTVATLLENADVPENVSADILGHDKPTMTYGLYSGGLSLEVKQAALERIDYPET